MTSSTIFDEHLSSLQNTDTFDGTTKHCKKSKNVSKYHATTAGVFCLIRPCGICVSFFEMYSSESCSQILTFLIRLLHTNNSIKCIAYDRCCELVPFLRNLANKKQPNLAAKHLLEHLDFMVDIFHIASHTTPCCILNNPQCEFHPHLEKFKKYSNPNSEAAEQYFSWLSRLKNSAKYMSDTLFFFFLHCNIHIRNNYVLTKNNLPIVPL